MRVASGRLQSSATPNTGALITSAMVRLALSAWRRSSLMASVSVQMPTGVPLSSTTTMEPHSASHMACAACATVMPGGQHKTLRDTMLSTVCDKDTPGSGRLTNKQVLQFNS